MNAYREMHFKHLWMRIWTYIFSSWQRKKHAIHSWLMPKCGCVRKLYCRAICTARKLYCTESCTANNIAVQAPGSPRRTYIRVQRCRYGAPPGFHRHIMTVKTHRPKGFKIRSWITNVIIKAVHMCQRVFQAHGILRSPPGFHRHIKTAKDIAPIGSRVFHSLTCFTCIAPSVSLVQSVLG